MKFCAILETYPKDTPGGAEFQSYLICRELARRGHETHYIAYNASSTRTCHDEGITVHRMSNPGMNKILQRLDEVDADFYYFRLLPDLPLLALTKYLMSGATIFNISHNAHCRPRFATWPGKPNPTVIHSVYRRMKLGLYRSLLSIPDYRFAQTNDQQTQLQTNWNLSSTLIGNGHPVPEEPFQKQSPPVVLWLASLKRWKRPHILFDVAEQCPDLSCEFWIVGRVVDEGLLTRVESLSNVKYKGECTIQESNEYIERASLFVNTSPEEGFPNTFIQAWLRHTPVISLSVDPDGVLKEHTIGFKTDNVSELVERIKELIENPEYQRELGKRAREYAIKHHDIRVIVDRIEQQLLV